ncbi:RNA polymerase sigma factor [Portibacter lacus]|uniref:RNA polymerase sigma factor n=1 Tax=Portibacter lacus TaxID=1099794 RepID=UPI001F4302C4|nr:sigma-70 family RNA polymerase sigma factor [Portibacter lacus]
MQKPEKNIDLKEDIASIQKYKKSRDQADMTVFFSKYMSMIYAVCLKYLKNEEKSKDAVMDIYEKLVEKLLKHEVAYPKSWLYTLTKNHCYEILRSQSRVLEKENQAAIMYSDDVYRLSNIEEKEAELGMLENCIEKLETEQQQSVRLFYLEKKTYKEVTDLMSITWSRARSLIQNGRRNLKNCMEKKYESIKEK